jgi:hypothetical protein
MDNNIDKSNHRLIVLSAILVIVGSMFSGPVGYLIVNLVNPIPWKDAPSFAAQYHPIQTLPYWFGFLYLAGFILFIAASRQLPAEKDRIFGDVSLVTTSLFAALIGFNYILQVGFIPNALDNPSEVFAAFAMNNPKSISWSIEWPPAKDREGIINNKWSWKYIERNPCFRPAFVCAPSSWFNCIFCLERYDLGYHDLDNY